MHFTGRALAVGMIVLASIGVASAQSWPGTIFDAEGGPLKLLNCSGNSIRVQTFNADDAVTLIAFERKSISSGNAAGLKCATRSCRVRIGDGNVYSPLSGPQVLLPGRKLQATNSAAVSQGCGVYVKPAEPPKPVIPDEGMNQTGNAPGSSSRR